MRLLSIRRIVGLGWQSFASLNFLLAHGPIEDVLNCLVLRTIWKDKPHLMARTKTFPWSKFHSLYFLSWFFPTRSTVQYYLITPVKSSPLPTTSFLFPSSLCVWWCCCLGIRQQACTTSGEMKKASCFGLPTVPLNYFLAHVSRRISTKGNKIMHSQAKDLGIMNFYFTDH